MILYKCAVLGAEHVKLGKVILMGEETKKVEKESEVIELWPRSGRLGSGCGKKSFGN